MHTSIMGSVVAVVGSLALGAALQAAPIAVPNGDFEEDLAGRTGSGAVAQVNGAPPSWTITGTAGTFSPATSTSGSPPTSPSNFWANYDFVEHGQLIAFTQSIATISQTLSNTYQAGQVYTLTVQVGDSYEGPSPVSDPVNNPDGLAYAIQLMAGSTVLASASDTVFPAANNSIFVPVVFDTADDPSAIGQPITIAIRGYTGGSATFDNVTLDAVPEPAALSLLGLGVLGLLRRRSA